MCCFQGGTVSNASMGVLCWRPSSALLQDGCRDGMVGICQSVLSPLQEIQQMGYSVPVCFSEILYLQVSFFMFFFFFFSCLFNNVEFSLQPSSSQHVLFSFLLQLIEVSGVACRIKKSNLRLLFYTSKGYWKILLACMRQQTCEQHFPIKTLKNFYWLFKVLTK